MNYREIYEKMRRRSVHDAYEYRDELERQGHSLSTPVYSRYDAPDGVEDSHLRRRAEKAYDDIRRQERYEEEEDECGDIDI